MSVIWLRTSLDTNTDTIFIQISYILRNMTCMLYILNEFNLSKHIRLIISGKIIKPVNNVLRGVHYLPKIMKIICFCIVLLLLWMNAKYYCEWKYKFQGTINFILIGWSYAIYAELKFFFFHFLMDLVELGINVTRQMSIINTSKKWIYCIMRLWESLNILFQWFIKMSGTVPFCFCNQT